MSNVHSDQLTWQLSYQAWVEVASRADTQPVHIRAVADLLLWRRRDFSAPSCKEQCVVLPSLASSSRSAAAAGLRGRAGLSCNANPRKRGQLCERRQSYDEISTAGYLSRYCGRKKSHDRGTGCRTSAAQFRPKGASCHTSACQDCPSHHTAPCLCTLALSIALADGNCETEHMPAWAGGLQSANSMATPQAKYNHRHTPSTHGFSKSSSAEVSMPTKPQNTTAFFSVAVAWVSTAEAKAACSYRKANKTDARHGKPELLNKCHKPGAVLKHTRKVTRSRLVFKRSATV